MNTTFNTKPINGIHHITAIAGSAAENHRFYTAVLGLRLVKKTVNFDDPGTYHLYFGDRTGSPGTILTFFPWEGIPQGQPGTGQVTAVGFSIPATSVGYWTDRLHRRGIGWTETVRFGETVIASADPHGLPLELVAVNSPPTTAAWNGGPVPAEHALHGFHSATSTLRSASATEDLLVSVMGMEKTGVEGNRRRYRMADRSAPGIYYDIVEAPGAPVGRQGAGSVHHIAFRAVDDADQLRWRRSVADHGLSVTGVRDRNYFRSIYFHEAGGVLFEIATDPPGFTVDETVDELGSRLMLPQWYERRRSEIERRLPPIPDADEMIHLYIPPDEDGKRLPTVVALHGTGGDEKNLIPLAEEVAGRGRAIISPRGRVNENGMARFFRRVAEGVFDTADVRRRARELSAFLQQASSKYGRAGHPLTAVGYSNGANIAAAVLLLHPGVFAEAVLFRPMIPVVPETLPDLRDTRVLIVRGKTDTVIPSEDTDVLIRILREAGADVTVVTMDTGHQLTAEDVRAAKDWLGAAEGKPLAAAI
jgi:glyoxalase family protein